MTADTVGGVWTYAIDLARALSGRGVHTTLASMGKPASEEQRRQAAGVPGLDLRESDYRLEWMSDPWDDLRAAGEWLLGLERETRPDLVHLNGYVHGALPFDAPVLVAGHSCVLSWWEAVRGGPAGPEWGRYRAAVTRGLRAAAMVVAPTAAMLAALERHYGPLPPSRVVPNGRDPSAFTPGDKEPFVLTVGRLWDDAKNLAAVSAVAPALPWKVVAAGDAGHPEGGQAATGSVEHLGTVGQDDLAGLMA
ncbi:MAG TPA: glycosyltransferase, partial [Deinococcales bacterium]|nr:glycosyltransferase [Deinococcales bacterium]